MPDSFPRLTRPLRRQSGSAETESPAISDRASVLYLSATPFARYFDALWIYSISICALRLSFA